MRDPRIDPCVGDVVIKRNGKGKELRRTVVRRKGNDIYYKTKPDGKECLCWITSWMEWCRTADEYTPA